MDAADILQIYRNLIPPITDISGSTAISDITDPKKPFLHKIPTLEEVRAQNALRSQYRELGKEALCFIRMFEIWLRTQPSVNTNSDCWNVAWICVLYSLLRGETPYINFLWGPGVAHVSCFWQTHKHGLVEVTVTPANEIPHGKFEFNFAPVGDIETWVLFWRFHLFMDGDIERIPGLEWYTDLFAIDSPEHYISLLTQQYSWVLEKNGPYALLPQAAVEAKLRGK